MIIAAVSGGLDSVGLLWHLLGEDEPVHVHHVSFRTIKTKRGAAEDAAMKRIVPWLRDQGFEFDYTESVYRPQQDPGGYDVVIVSRHIGRLCMEQKLKPVAYCRGGALHDEAVSGIKRRRKAARLEWRRWWKPGQVPPVRFPLSTMGRADIWAMLPEELRQMTTSCRRPIVRDETWAACGKCRPCLEMQADAVPLARDIPA